MVFMFNLGESIVAEFYFKNPRIEIYPLSAGATPDNIVQTLQEKGYCAFRATPEEFPALFKMKWVFERDGTQGPCEDFLVSKREKLLGVVRYRKHTGGDSVKIEGIDPEIKEALLPLLFEGYL